LHTLEIRLDILILLVHAGLNVVFDL
jgi:hypothetical protein